MAGFWPRWRGSSPPSPEEYAKEIEQLRKKAPIPAIWLFGKTGSGKSSIVRYLTGAELATVGEGFRPETKTSRRFDFPDAVEPLLSFIDTRGLGEAAYDPDKDIERFANSTQLIVIAVRVTDQALQSIIEPLRRIRKASPERPMLLVVTCLHEAAGSIDLSQGPDPFAVTEDRTKAKAKAKPKAQDTAEARDPTIATEKAETAAQSEGESSGETAADPRAIPAALKQLIDQKVKQFKGLHDIVIPIDLTKTSDGFADPNFGGQRLKQAILEHLPHAYRQALLTLNQSEGGESDRQRRTRWQVLASSALAASAGAVPLPWVDIPVVLGIQAHLALRIAAIYEQEVTPADWAVLSSVAGTRIVIRMVVLEALKFIPLLGMAAGAAGSFAFTYALGMSWEWYFANQRGGNVPSTAKLKEIFKEQLKRGNELWRAE